MRSEKIQRPKLVIKEGFTTDEAFNYFEHAWGEYKVLASITTAAKQHLSSCLGEEVSTLVYNRYGKTGYEGLDEAGLLEAARGLVVKTRNKLVTKLQLQKMSQGEEEPVQTFLGRMKPIARNCGFKLQCPSPTRALFSSRLPAGKRYYRKISCKKYKPFLAKKKKFLQNLCFYAI